MKIVAPIQVRMGSSRLPGKTLMELAGRPMLQTLCERLAGTTRVDEIMIATSTSPGDDAIADLGGRMGLAVFRGDEEDVLRRVVEAGRSVNADVLVDLTGDNPYVDARLVDRAVELFLKAENKWAYVHTDRGREFPLGYVCQVYSLEALEKALKETPPHGPHREHTNFYIYHHPDLFPPVDMAPWPEVRGRAEVRLTIDYPEDYEQARRVFEHLSVNSLTFPIEDVLAFMDQNPEIAALNAHCRQHRPQA